MDMRGSTENHHIQWSAFESNIARTFGDLKEDKAFADVALVCGNQRLEANKIVLSVGSTFFRRIFNENPHPHPLIYMVGIKFSDLEALLNFAYFGEAFVVKDDLNSFFAAAERLEMKGLVPVNNSFEDFQQQQGLVQAPEAGMQHQHQASSKELSENNNDDGDQFYEAEPVPMIKLEDEDDLQTGIEEHFEEGVATSNISERFQDYIVKICEGEDMGKAKCTICGKLSRDRHDVARHVESRHFPGTKKYQCGQCDKVFKTNNERKDHRSRIHSGASNSRKENLVEDFFLTAAEEHFKDAGTTRTQNNDFQDFRSYTIKICGGEYVGKVKCTVCGRFLSCSRSAARHVEDIHFPGTYKYQCDQCDQVFEIKSKLDSHRSKNHSGARRGDKSG